MSKQTPELRKARARLGALTLAAKHDPRVTTAPGRAALLARFAAEVAASDPDGKLDPVERARRAEYLKRAHFARLSYLALAARVENAAARKLARQPRAASDAAPAGGDNAS